MKKLVLLLGLLFALLGSAYAAVDVNTATKDELDSLKGVGPVKAQAIIDYRTKNGPFKSVDDLKNVPGIGPKTLEDIRKDVRVGGSAAAAKPPAGSKSAEPAKTTPPAKGVEPNAASTTKAGTTADKAAAKKDDVASKAPEKKDSTKGGSSDKKEDAKTGKTDKNLEKK